MFAMQKYFVLLDSEQTAYRSCSSVTTQTASAFVFPTDVGKTAPYALSFNNQRLPRSRAVFFHLQLQALNIQPPKRERPIICAVKNGIS
jgi:hypothetical protein